MTDLLPHSREAEEAVVGSILIDPQAIYNVLPLIGADDFYSHGIKAIFAAVQSLSERGKGIDIITVTEQLTRDGNIELAGGQAYLTKLLMSAGSALNVEEYANVVRDYSLRRRGIIIANDIAKAAINTAEEFDPNDFANDLVTVKDKPSCASFEEAMSGYWDWYSSRLEKPGQLSGYATGLQKIDALTDGFEAGTTTILFGYPGLGKSILADQIAKSIQTTYGGAVIYTLEIKHTMIINRWLSAMSKVEAHHMKRGDTDELQQKAITDAIEWLEEHCRIDIVDDPNNTSAKIRADILRRRAQGRDVKFIVVDYAGKLTDPIRKGEDELDRQERVIKSMVKICKELNVASILIHTLNKNNEIAGRMGVLYECDNALYMYQDKDFGDGAEAKCHVVIECKKIRDQSSEGSGRVKLRKYLNFPEFTDKEPGEE